MAAKGGTSPAPPVACKVMCGNVCGNLCGTSPGDVGGAWPAPPVACKVRCVRECHVSVRVCICWMQGSVVMSVNICCMAVGFVACKVPWSSLWALGLTGYCKLICVCV